MRELEAHKGVLHDDEGRGARRGGGGIEGERIEQATGSRWRRWRAPLLDGLRAVVPLQEEGGGRSVGRRWGVGGRTRKRARGEERGEGRVTSFQSVHKT